MAKQADHALVGCADYNGNKNVFFMMKTDDPRYGDENYLPLGVGAYDRKAKTFAVEGVVYRVFPDWSLRKI